MKKIKRKDNKESWEGKCQFVYEGKYNFETHWVKREKDRYSDRQTNRTEML